MAEYNVLYVLCTTSIKKNPDGSMTGLISNCKCSACVELLEHALIKLSGEHIDG